jgi:hypothetical protein
MSSILLLLTILLIIVLPTDPNNEGSHTAFVTAYNNNAKKMVIFTWRGEPLMDGV